MDINQLFIDNLKKWRKIKGYSQKNLAEKCNAAHSYIRQLESGKGHPSLAFIGKIAAALQIEPYQLFYDETVPPSQPAYIRNIEIMQNKLLVSISKNIQATFDDLKNY